MKEKIRNIDLGKLSLILACLLSVIRIGREVYELVTEIKTRDKIEARLGMIDLSCSIMEGRITFLEKMREEDRKAH